MKRTHFLALGLMLSWLMGSALLCSAAESRKHTLAEARVRFQEVDKGLNDTYEVARKKLSTEKFQQLRDEQRIWLGFREELALAPSYSGVPDDPVLAKRSAEYFDALVELTKERDEWITQAWIFGLLEGDASDALTAIWRDRSGGYMETFEEGAKLHFLIRVVRGRKSRISVIAGVAQWNERIGWFKERGGEKDQASLGNLAFVSRDRKRLEVIASTTAHQFGDIASFEGDYIKVGRLSEPARLKLLKAAETGQIDE